MNYWVVLRRRILDRQLGKTRSTEWYTDCIKNCCRGVPHWQVPIVICSSSTTVPGRPVAGKTMVVAVAVTRPYLFLRLMFPLRMECDWSGACLVHNMTTDWARLLECTYCVAVAYVRHRGILLCFRSLLLDWTSPASSSEAVTQLNHPTPLIYPPDTWIKNSDTHELCNGPKLFT